MFFLRFSRTFCCDNVRSINTIKYYTYTSPVFCYNHNQTQQYSMFLMSRCSIIQVLLCRSRILLMLLIRSDSIINSDIMEFNLIVSISSEILNHISSKILKYITIVYHIIKYVIILLNILHSYIIQNGLQTTDIKILLNP